MGLYRQKEPSNDAFAIFPAVEQRDLLKKICYRALGVGLISVSGYEIHQVLVNIVLPVRFHHNSR